MPGVRPSGRLAVETGVVTVVLVVGTGVAQSRPLGSGLLLLSLGGGSRGGRSVGGGSHFVFGHGFQGAGADDVGDDVVTVGQNLQRRRRTSGRGRRCSRSCRGPTHRPSRRGEMSFARHSTSISWATVSSRPPLRTPTAVPVTWTPGTLASPDLGGADVVEVDVLDLAGQNVVLIVFDQDFVHQSCRSEA